MPIYDYRCNHCDISLEKISKIANRDKQKCPQCGFVLHRVVTTNNRNAFAWQYKNWEHIAPHPLKINSKRELRAACDKYGVTAHMLD